MFLPHKSDFIVSQLGLLCKTQQEREEVIPTGLETMLAALRQPVTTCAFEAGTARQLTAANHHRTVTNSSTVARAVHERERAKIKYTHLHVCLSSVHSFGCYCTLFLDNLNKWNRMKCSCCFWIGNILSSRLPAGTHQVTLIFVVCEFGPGKTTNRTFKTVGMFWSRPSSPGLWFLINCRRRSRWIHKAVGWGAEESRIISGCSQGQTLLLTPSFRRNLVAEGWSWCSSVRNEHSSSLG